MRHFIASLPQNTMGHFMNQKCAKNIFRLRSSEFGNYVTDQNFFAFFKKVVWNCQYFLLFRFEMSWPTVRKVIFIGGSLMKLFLFLMWRTLLVVHMQLVITHLDMGVENLNELPNWWSCHFLAPIIWNSLFLKNEYLKMIL